MNQCLAITKAGKRCKRFPAEDCAGYCKAHFDNLPPNTAEAAARRAIAKNLLRKAGRVIGTGAAAGVILRDIWEIVGPFLTLRESYQLEILTNPNIPTETRKKSCNILLTSLEQENTVPVAFRPAERK